MAVALLLVISSSSLNASEISKADSLWNEAGAAYEMGEWTSAIETYDAISSMGVESPQLYYNMGNAYYRLGDYANAVLYYERALKLDSSLTDALFNLEHVNGLLQDKIDVVPEFFLKEWLRNLSRTMSSNSWAWLSLGLLAVTLVLLLVFRLASSITWRRAGFFTGLVALLIMVAALSFSAWQRNDYMAHDEAVVMKTVTSVKSSPSSDNSTDLFILHEGTKVHVLVTSGAWTNVSLADGRQGWMKTADIEII
jgi:tetratricopeptide (TPR) repeat protein